MMTANPEGPRHPAEIVGHWIDGRPIAASPAARTQPVYNPARGIITREVVLATTDDVSNAVRSAQGAFSAWADTPPVRRARILNRFLALLARHCDRIAATITNEHGKVLADAQGEVMRSIEVVEFSCGIPHMLKGDYTEQ